MTPSYYDTFLSRYPDYTSTRALDDLRATDYARLDAAHHVYLDYTGGGLYAQSQISAEYAMLSEGVFGNPHSTNPTSAASTRRVESAREAVLKFFHADPAEYVVIFTSNASGALKLVGESYPFAPGSRYLLTFDNHNSVNGIREFAIARGASVSYLPVLPPRMRADESRVEEALNIPQTAPHNLFAYPAQSNFSAVQHPLAWIERAHTLGWDVLLDAAAFAPSNVFDLSAVHPDFVPISFYKMFGFPTGIGALIARRPALAKLHRPWFAGGTITVASVQANTHYLAPAPAAFEDGTLDYLNIPAVETGLAHLQSIGMPLIHTRVTCLTGWLLDNMLDIKHPNGLPLIKIYGPVTTDARGGTIAMNFVTAEGAVIDHTAIEQRANRANISLRTGCFCNPGAGELALGISSGELTSCFTRPDHAQRLTYDEFRLCIDGKASGAVRISVGLASNFADVEAFLAFARGLVE